MGKENRVYTSQNGKQFRFHTQGCFFMGDNIAEGFQVSVRTNKFTLSAVQQVTIFNSNSF